MIILLAFIKLLLQIIYVVSISAVRWQCKEVCRASEKQKGGLKKKTGTSRIPFYSDVVIHRTAQITSVSNLVSTPSTPPFFFSFLSGLFLSSLPTNCAFRASPSKRVSSSKLPDTVQQSRRSHKRTHPLSNFLLLFYFFFFCLKQKLLHDDQKTSGFSSHLVAIHVRKTARIFLPSKKLCLSSISFPYSKSIMVCI